MVKRTFDPETAARARKAALEARRAQSELYETPYETHGTPEGTLEYRVDRKPGVGIEVTLVTEGNRPTKLNPSGVVRKVWWLRKDDPRLGDPKGLARAMRSKMGV